MVTSGLEGNMQAEPRIFAHDAVTVPTIGAVTGLYTDINEPHWGSTLYGGTGYSTGTGIATTGGSGAASLTVDITSVDGGVITGLSINTAGSAYLEGETITVSGGGANATVKISTAIPGTTARGCALYIGSAGNITVTMESGNSATFSNLNSGTFLPILVTHITAATAGSILAIY